jgi:hypothetical protein
LARKFLELYGAVSAVQAVDNCAVGSVEGRPQAGRAIADVVMSALLGHTGHHLERWLRPSQHLELGFLI